jgi:hypothetical protein
MRRLNVDCLIRMAPAARLKLPISAVVTISWRWRVSIMQGLLDIVFESPRLIVLAAKDCPHLVLGDGAGVIIGTLFEKGAARSVQRLSPPAVAVILQTPGQALIDGYWGGYVALLANAEADSLHILRDPSGCVPCFRVGRTGFDLFMSEPTLALDGGLLQASIDWPGLTLHLSDQLRTARTCLEHVFEQLAGSRRARALTTVRKPSVCIRLIPAYHMWKPRSVDTGLRAGVGTLPRYGDRHANAPTPVRGSVGAARGDRAPVPKGSAPGSP